MGIYGKVIGNEKNKRDSIKKSIRSGRTVLN